MAYVWTIPWPLFLFTRNTTHLFDDHLKRYLITFAQTYRIYSIYILYSIAGADLLSYHCLNCCNVTARIQSTFKLDWLTPILIFDTKTTIGCISVFSHIHTASRILIQKLLCQNDNHVPENYNTVLYTTTSDLKYSYPLLVLFMLLH